MKTKKHLLFLLIVVFIASCKSDDDHFFPEQLSLINEEVTSSFDSLNNSITSAVIIFETRGVDSIAMRAKLLELYNESTFSSEFVYTSPEGIMSIIEPSEYYSSQGTDISNQPHVVKAFQSKKAVLSDAFMVVEGYQAAVSIHPIVQDDAIIGAISAVIVPSDLLSRIIEPVVANQDFEVWVMEKTGLILYDQDQAAIGLNIFNDPMYDNYPLLKEACAKIADEETGETSYSFYKKGTNTLMYETAYWETFHMQGNQWKIIYVKPE